MKKYKFKFVHDQEKPFKTPNLEVARRVNWLCSKGLTAGAGNPVPGEMCVEAAVCYAMNLKHGDNPRCVSKDVRRFKILLNDSDGWMNDASRGRGLRKIAIAQLGSSQMRPGVFMETLAEQFYTSILPYALEHIRPSICVGGSGWRGFAREWSKRLRAVKMHNARVIDALLNSLQLDVSKFVYGGNGDNLSFVLGSLRDYSSRKIPPSVDRLECLWSELLNIIPDEKKQDLLLLIADAGLIALKKAKSPGCKWLHLVEK